MIPRVERNVPVEPENAAPDWSPLARFGFQFAFCYFILIVYPSILGARALVDHDSGNLLRRMWDQVVPWVGSHVFHLNEPVAATFSGSGDQLYDYVLWPCLLVTALLAAAIWSALDRKRREYRDLYEWLRVLVRLTLAIAMISYGMDKLYRFQFPELRLAKLVQTYGQSSPAGLLWASMDYSRAYSFLSGLGETAGGVLLLVPSLTTLGALLTLAIMSNVLMLNLFYDVPRKILSIHLILMGLFLLLPDVRRLFNLFVLNREAQLTKPAPLFRDKLFNRATSLFQIAIGIGAIVFCAHRSSLSSAERAAQIEQPFRGIWSVETFDYDGAPRPPLLTDNVRWRRVILDYPDIVTVQLMDGQQETHYLRLNSAAKNLELWRMDDHQKEGRLAIETARADRLFLRGELDGHRIDMQLTRTDMQDPSKFLLVNRGFRWINPKMLIR